MKTKLIKTLSLLLTLSALATTPAFAATTEKGYDDVKVKVEATLINNETKREVRNIDNEPIVKSIEDLSSSKEEDGAITKTYKVNLGIPLEGQIQARDSQSGSKSEASCSTTLTIKYYKNSAGDKIKITNISGGWTPESKLVIISNRVASVTDGRGAFIQKELRKKPTSNSFSYDTGWDYVTYVPSSDYSGPRGYTEATLSISGMSGTSHNLFLTVGL